MVKSVLSSVQRAEGGRAEFGAKNLTWMTAERADAEETRPTKSETRMWKRKDIWENEDGGREGENMSIDR